MKKYQVELKLYHSEVIPLKQLEQELQAWLVAKGYQHPDIVAQELRDPLEVKGPLILKELGIQATPVRTAQQLKESRQLVGIIPSGVKK